jgi:hypothetical protein
VEEPLLSSSEAMSSIPSTVKEKERRRRRQRQKERKKENKKQQLSDSVLLGREIQLP